jgi:hypothetical protein
MPPPTMMILPDDDTKRSAVMRGLDPRIHHQTTIV